LDIIELRVGAGRSGSVVTPVDHTTRPPTPRKTSLLPHGTRKPPHRTRETPPPSPAVATSARPTGTPPPSPFPISFASPLPSPPFPHRLTPFIFLLDLQRFEEAARSSGGRSVHHPRRLPFPPASLLVGRPRRPPSPTTSTAVGASSNRKVHLLKLPSDPP
jgi:hypothetical protein